MTDGRVHRLALAPALGLALALGPACGNGDRPAVPAADLSRMEPRVAELLDQRRQAVIDRPGVAETWGRLGAAYQAHRLIAEAEACYRRARELAPDEFRWAYLAAIAREVAGADAGELIARFEEAARLRPGYAPSHVRLGDALSIRGRLDEAQAAFRRALALDPGIAVAHRGLGRILLVRGEVRQALVHLQRAAELSPEDGAAHAALAQAYLRASRPDLAEQAAARAGRLNPSSGIPDPVYGREVAALAVSSRRAYARARRHLDEGNLDDAVADLKIAAEARPDDAAVHHLLGVAYSGLDRNDAAIAALTRATELDPRLAGAHTRLGHLLEAAGRREAALRHYARVVELRPDDPSGHIHFGTGLMRAGAFDLALDRFERAVTLRPDDPDAHYGAGEALLRLGDTGRAIAHFEAAVAIDPDHRARRSLARLGSLR